MGVLVAQNRPSVSAFPDSTVGSACTSTFSRFARRLLALRPAHSRGHQIRDRYPGASDISSPPCLLRLLPAGAVAGWASHPLESAALSRRTWKTDLRRCCRQNLPRFIPHGSTGREIHCAQLDHSNSSISAFAALRSVVSKPSLN